MSKPGDYCRSHKDQSRPSALRGCSGEGRPSCKATECMYGAEPCPNGNHWKAEGAPCNFCRSETREVSHA